MRNWENTGNGGNTRKKDVRVVRLILFVVAIIPLILAGCCISPPIPPMSSAIPSDLEISYGYGACHAEWGRTDIRIDAKGQGVYAKGSGSLLENGRFEREEFRKTFSLNESELLDLLNRIETNGFYALNDYYSDPNIADGSCSAIFITKNNITKSVAVSNVRAPAVYSKVADLIYNLAVNKTASN